MKGQKKEVLKENIIERPEDSISKYDLENNIEVMKRLEKLSAYLRVYEKAKFQLTSLSQREIGDMIFLLNSFAEEGDEEHQTKD
jgi:hypothetical protein